MGHDGDVMCDAQSDSTLAYYERNARSFCAATVALDLSPLYARFLPLLPAGGHILDVGCGSGRDARAFLAQGYTVTAFDASPALAQQATAYCGIPVQVLRVQEVPWVACFDGIWACASLLHVPMRELPEVLGRLTVALKPGGVLYLSFKYGHGERHREGRHFTNLDEAGLLTLLDAVPGLLLRELWITADQRPDRHGEQWLNAVVAGSA